MRYGIYTHHPWCKRRCSYCSFNIFIDPNPPFQQWKDGIQKDWAQEQSYFQGQAYSLYFGGGTPSLAPPSIIKELIIGFDLQEEAEVSLEINPGDLNRNQLFALQDAGVNRYSVGIQSFNPKFSRLLNRSHTVHDNHILLKLFEELKPRSWSLDLMFGLPNQSLTDLRWDLDQALLHSPPHISLYGLTVEEGTPLQRGVKKGVIKPIKEDIWFEQFQTIIERLHEEGYEQYEISNFARPNHRSQHNEHIWKNGFYAGLGPGAHGYRPNQTRTVQHAKWEDWRTSSSPFIERASEEEATIDYILTVLRHIDGLSLPTLRARGFEISEATTKSLKAKDLIMYNGSRIRLSKQGVFIADSVILEIIRNLKKIVH